MSPICRLIDFCIRTFCSTGGWNCAAVSNDGLGFMRVVGREQSIVSRANSPAIVTFVRVFWAKYCELRRGEGPLGSGHRAPAQQPGVCSGQWRAPSGGARQLRFLCVPWWWTSCLAAWPELSQRELFHSLRWCRVQCLLLLSTRPGDTGVNTLDTENKTLPPPERYLLPGVMFSPGLVTINTLAAQREGVGGENVISQPL